MYCVSQLILKFVRNVIILITILPPYTSDRGPFQASSCNNPTHSTTHPHIMLSGRYRALLAITLSDGTAQID